MSANGVDVSKDFRQLEWSPELEQEWRQLLALAVREDLDRTYDWTTAALVPPNVPGRATIVAREKGVIAGILAAQIAMCEFDRAIRWNSRVEDGSQVDRGQPLVELEGSARSLLTAERTVLNVLGHLSGIATTTRRYVQAVAGTRARIYDTRKTTPGWRRLEKYAVRCGGGYNHRSGLYDAVLIKDNHLAVGQQMVGGAVYTAADAVIRVREFLAKFHAMAPEPGEGFPIIEVEVDSLEQLRQVLPTQPDIVLLDNMAPPDLREAVALRDAGPASAELEASGGITLDTIGEIAAAGVDRISVGGLTHSAPALDVALDWHLGIA